jgi:ferredoxin
MFPKLIKQVSNTHIKIQQKFVGESRELVIDRFQCVGCGVCSRTCPQEAISIGPAVSSYTKKKTLLSLIDDSIDEHECVFCGACMILCPFDAIQLFQNGKKLKPEENTLITKKSIPKLNNRLVPLTRLKKVGKIYWEGEIESNYKFPESKKEFLQYYINKCPGDCRKCVEICPNEAISFFSIEDAWQAQNIFQIDDSKCIKCRACQNVCPQNNLKVTWTKVNYSGSFNERFWISLEERLLDP